MILARRVHTMSAEIQISELNEGQMPWLPPGGGGYEPHMMVWGGGQPHTKWFG